MREDVLDKSAVEPHLGAHENTGSLWLLTHGFPYLSVAMNSVDQGPFCYPLECRGGGDNSVSEEGKEVGICGGEEGILECAILGWYSWISSVS